jgi:hypothetical protein
MIPLDERFLAKLGRRFITFSLSEYFWFVFRNLLRFFSLWLAKVYYNSYWFRIGTFTTWTVVVLQSLSEKIKQPIKKKKKKERKSITQLSLP